MRRSPLGSSSLSLLPCGTLCEYIRSDSDTVSSSACPGASGIARIDEQAYSGLGASADKPQELKTRDSVAYLISSLHWVYKRHGHDGCWSRMNESGHEGVYGNPLDGTSLMRDFKKTNAKKIADLDRVV
eukprot:IDg8281t1